MIYKYDTAPSNLERPRLPSVDTDNIIRFARVSTNSSVASVAYARHLEKCQQSEENVDNRMLVIMKQHIPCLPMSCLLWMCRTVTCPTPLESPQLLYALRAVSERVGLLK